MSVPRTVRVLFVLLLVMLSFSLLGAQAQEATPAADDVSPLQGVTFEVLSGGGEPVAAPGQTLVVVRMTIDPGGFIIAHGHPGAQIWYVEAGAFSTTMLEGTMQVTRAADGDTPAPAEPLAAGAETTLSAGDSAFFDADVLHTVRHAGDEPTVVLIPALFETGQEPLIFHTHD
jgi:quercetin dioxygenase-like cupin family protein